MAKVKHSPGPWKAGQMTMSYKDLLPYDSEQTFDIVQHGPHVIAIVYCAEDRDGEEAANAKLIAAAPDLLEALKKIVIDEKNRAKNLRHRKAWKLVEFSEARLRAAELAIAKAETP
jgi:hypothetical protein